MSSVNQHSTLGSCHTSCVNSRSSSNTGVFARVSSGPKMWQSARPDYLAVQQWLPSRTSVLSRGSCAAARSALSDRQQWVRCSGCGASASSVSRCERKEFDICSLCRKAAGAKGSQWVRCSGCGASASSCRQISLLQKANSAWDFLVCRPGARSATGSSGSGFPDAAPAPPR